MFLKHIARAGVVGCGLLMATSAFAQSVGVVDSAKVLTDVAEIKKAQEALSAKYKPKEAELEALQKEIVGIQQQLQQGQGKLTPAAESDLTVRGQMKQRQFERLRDDVQQQVEEERQSVLGKAQDHLRAAISEVAKAKNLDVVVDRASTLFAKDAVDITKEVVAAYDKANPVK